jgi:DNA invertase Pin-like site-specific DNA recombinase
MTKAYAYVRVSGKGQILADGPDRQRESIAKYAAAQSITIVQEFFEAGVSGTKDSFDRPALTELFTALRADGVRMVLVERADRLARDLMISEIILAEFKKLGVKVIEVEGGNDLTVEDNEPTKVLIRQILACVAQFEKCCMVQKLASARLRIRQAGKRCEGPKPYGDRDGERRTINVIQELHASGLPLLHIANRLNSMGIKPRNTTARWHPQTVKRVIDAAVDPWKA